MHNARRGSPVACGLQLYRSRRRGQSTVDRVRRGLDHRRRRRIAGRIECSASWSRRRSHHTGQGRMAPRLFSVESRCREASTSTPVVFATDAYVAGRRGAAIWCSATAMSLRVKFDCRQRRGGSGPEHSFGAYPTRPVAHAPPMASRTRSLVAAERIVALQVKIGSATSGGR